MRRRIAIVAAVALASGSALADPPATGKAAAPVPVAEAVCPEGDVCLTPDELKGLIAQQIEAYKAEQIAETPAVRSALDKIKKAGASKK